MKIQANKWYIILDAYGDCYLDRDILKDRDYFNSKAAALDWVQGTKASDEGTRKVGPGCYEFLGSHLICTGASLIADGYSF